MHERSPGGAAIERTKRIQGWQGEEEEEEEERFLGKVRERGRGTRIAARWWRARPCRRRGASIRRPARQREGHSKNPNPNPALLPEQLFSDHPRPLVPLHVDRPHDLIPHRIRPGIRKSLFPFKEILASPPDANRPQRKDERGRRLLRQRRSEGRIELPESFTCQDLRCRPAQLRGEEQRVDADRRPGRREREVMGPRGAKDAVRSALDLVFGAGRAGVGDRLRRDDGRERVDRGERNEGAEQIHAGAEDERERSREAHGTAGARARETCEGEERRQRRQEKARPPSRLSVPRPPGGRGEEERGGRSGERRTRAARRAGEAQGSRTARGGRSAHTRTALCSGAP